MASKQISRVDLIRAETNDGRSKYIAFGDLTFLYIFHFKYHIFNLQKHRWKEQEICSLKCINTGRK